MRTATCCITAVMMTTGITVGQQKTDAQLKVLTVCEVLGDVTQHADTAVVVVGRMERSVSLTDHYEFLSQDRCEHGHVWSNKIQIRADWREGMPKPPTDRPKLERSFVGAKLRVVLQTIPPSPTEFAAVYGRIVRVSALNEAGGWGGNDAPFVVIAEPYNILKLREDLRPQSEHR